MRDKRKEVRGGERGGFDKSEDRLERKDADKGKEMETKGARERKIETYMAELAASAG